MRRPRHILVAATATAIAIVIVWWLAGDEPDFTVRLVVSSPQTAMWRPVTATAITSRSWGPRWTFTWSTSTGRITGTGATVKFAAGDPGMHTVRVRVRGPGGIEHTAEARVEVVRLPFYRARDSRVVQPDEEPLDLPAVGFRVSQVTLSADQVCRYESTVVTIEGEDDRGSGMDRWLTPAISGQLGWTATFTPNAIVPGTYKIDMLLRDPEKDAAFAMTSAYVTLADCVAPLVMSVDNVEVRNRPEVRDFTAVMVEGPAWDRYVRGIAPDGTPQVPAPTAVHAARYHWNFGDGAVEDTAGPTVRHTYAAEENRDPDRRMDSHLVTVVALDEHGKSLATAHTSVSLLNYYADAKRLTGKLILMPVLPPHAVPGPDRFLVSDVTLLDLDHTESAVLGDLDVSMRDCAGKELGHTKISTATVFGTTTVRPRGRITGKLRDPSRTPGVCQLYVEIKGTSTPGNLEAFAFFNVTLVEPPSATRPVRADDSAIIQTAIRLTGKTEITDDDLEQLERDGKLPPGTFAAIVRSRTRQ